MKTVELKQGTGENQVRLSVNMDDDIKEMMDDIRDENMSKWVDRDYELYVEACKRLKKKQDGVISWDGADVEGDDIPEEEYKFHFNENSLETPETNDKEGKSAGRIALYVVISIVFAGLLYLILNNFFVIAIALFVGAFCLDAMFGSGNKWKI